MKKQSCSCCDGCGNEGEGLDKSNRAKLIQIGLTVVIFATGMIIKPQNQLVEMAIFLVAYLIIGWEVLWTAIKNIFHGKFLDENFLMAIASIGAFVIGLYSEGVVVMLFYQVGEFFQDYAVGRSRRSITALMDIRPDSATVLRDGVQLIVSPIEVQIGEIILVKAGERVPLDGIIIEGNSSLDTSALTGESLPREVTTDSELLSGCVNLNGLLTARVTKEYGQSTVAKILDLVENAAEKKSESENFITKFARVYTPLVVAFATLLAVVPPLVFSGQSFSDWVYRALVFLVMSCPCALVISVPLGFFGGIGGASKSGILVKGGNFLEALAHTELVVFDKTGTLTKGIFAVAELAPENCTKEVLLEAAAYAENYSNHPISISIQKAYGKAIDSGRIGSVGELSGFGVRAVVDGREVLAGNAKLMAQNDVDYHKGEIIGTVVHVAVEGKYAGFIVIADEVKPDSARAISELKTLGIAKTVMLTGDAKSAADKVSATLGLDEVHSQLLPADKVEKLEELLKKRTKGGRLAFVGDGINDAPVLALADVGIAMGGLGSDAAIEAADIVIMTDEPSKIATAIKLSRRTLTIVKQNIVFAIAVKVIVLLLGALGFATMWAAVFADVGVSILAILNSMRAMKKID